jgi:hypothetical protein
MLMCWRSLEALILGERDPQVLAQFARASMRSKIPALTEALTGTFGEHHAFMVRLHLDRIDQLARTITVLTDQIDTVMEPFRAMSTVEKPVPDSGNHLLVVPPSLLTWQDTRPGSTAGRSSSASASTRR